MSEKRAREKKKFKDNSDLPLVCWVYSDIVLSKIHTYENSSK